MVQAIFRTVLIGFVALLLSSCANYPEPFLVKDTLGISKSLSDALTKKFGLFVTVNSKIVSTDDLINYKLLLLWDTDGHMDMKIAMLGMEKTHDFLFGEVIFMDSIYDVEVSNPTKDVPYRIKRDTLISRDSKELPRVRNTYVNANMNKIFERSLNSDDIVYVMRKGYSKLYSNRLKELIVE